MRLNDPEIVRREYASDERIRRRRLDRWGAIEGANPYEVAFDALIEAYPQRVLDAGCGPGEVGEDLQRRLNCKLVAVDSSVQMVNLAQGRGLDARVADLRELPFDDGEFDAALAMNVLYHLPDIDTAVAELARVVRPGGRLVAGTHFSDHLEELWGRDENLGFAGENGRVLLAASFTAVERRAVEGAVVFPDADALREYLAGFETLHGVDETKRANGLEYPFRAGRHNAVFVAMR